MDRLSDITHKFDVSKILAAAIGYKGNPLPILMTSQLLHAKTIGATQNSSNIVLPTAAPTAMATSAGTPLRREDAMGRSYFLPVILKTAAGKEIEIPNAAISFTGKKTIIKTPLSGVNGSVKELVTLDDYSIEIAGVVIGADGNYPEDEITQIRELWQLNESVELICAVTDIWIGLNTKIVLESVSIPEVGAFEDAQIIKITAETDADLEMTIE